jgi:nucleoside-diphosphate-sugar epimerase
MSRADLGAVLVTGGGGFLGTAVIRLLRERGLPVRSLARRYYPHLEPLGVEQIQGDVAEPRVVAKAVEDCRTVFHTAAKAGKCHRRKSRLRVDTNHLHQLSQRGL